MLQSFPITPASSGPLWFLAAFALLLGAVLAVFAYTVWSSRHSRVEVGPAHVRLVGDFWGRSLPLSALDLDICISEGIPGADAADAERTP